MQWIPALRVSGEATGSYGGSSSASSLRRIAAFWTCILVLLLQVLTFCPDQAEAIRWLGIYRLPKSAEHPVDKPADRFTSSECQKAANELGLRRRQAQFCIHHRFGYAMLAVLRAAHAVGYHCPKTFADRRWNCSSIQRLPQMSQELQRGTREQALVHAFASAALLFEIARYCAHNKIRFCSCGDEASTYPMSQYMADPNHPTTSVYTEATGALVYQSVAPNDLGRDGIMATGPSVDAQSTVSRFYWAGCSDNLHVAREYTSAFLGFPTAHLAHYSNSELRDMRTNLERLARSVDVHSTATTDQPGAQAHSQEEGDCDVEDDEDGEDEEEDKDLVTARHGVKVRLPRSGDQPWYNRVQTRGGPTRTPDSYRYPPNNYYSATPYRPSYDNNYPRNRWSRRPRSRNKNRRRRSIIRQLNRHNYLAGVIVMEAHQDLVCKCHGVSGSCAQRVCFRQLRRIDNEIMQQALKFRYLAAKQVTLGPNRELFAKTFTGSGFVDEVVQPEELVFSEPSPDYCNLEPRRGSVGTKGRLCNLRDSGTASCVNMCCGRGFTNTTIRELVECNCRVGEGYKVQCDRCSVENVIHHCL